MIIISLKNPDSFFVSLETANVTPACVIALAVGQAFGLESYEDGDCQKKIIPVRFECRGGEARRAGMIITMEMNDHKNPEGVKKEIGSEQKENSDVYRFSGRSRRYRFD